MKILVTGGKGQLGREIADIVKKGEANIGQISKTIKESKFVFVDIDNLDITNINEVKTFVSKEKPDIIINCAAYTNVDQCESDRDIAFKVNALGARNLAVSSDEIGSKLIHISTDYVFGAKKRNTPFNEWDKTSPLGVYGGTKLLGEKYVMDFCSKYFVVRTSWLYGRYGNNFVYTMLKLGKTQESIKVVNDQIGNPTNANDLAYHILKLIESEEYGIYHCTGNGQCSWFDFAKNIMKLAKLECKVEACTSEEFIRKAKRPAYSSLDNMMLRCTVGDSMRSWEEALKMFIYNLEILKE